MRLRLNFLFLSVFFFFSSTKWSLFAATAFSCNNTNIRVLKSVSSSYLLHLFYDCAFSRFSSSWKGEIIYSWASDITVSYSPSEQPLIKANLTTFNDAYKTHLFFTKAKAEWAVWPAQKGNDRGLEDTLRYIERKSLILNKIFVVVKQSIC